MHMPERKRIRCQIFLEERNNGTLWVPYKTLIGYGARHRVMHGGRGEHLYTWQEFANRSVAIDQAKRRALNTIHAKFTGVQAEDIEWNIVQESAAGLITV